MDAEQLPYTLLRWSRVTGFELDLTAKFDTVMVRLVSVPVPVDGIDGFSAEPVALHRLDVLFKAHVDWDGAPGQLDDVTVQLVEKDGRPALHFAAAIEDAESGDRIHVKTTIPTDIPPAAPAAGGPVPSSPEEDDLDWDDENTLESLFGDMDVPLTTSERRRDEEDDDSDEVPQTPPAGKGLAALLRSLAGPLRDEPTDDVPRSVLETIAGPPSTEAPAPDEQPEAPAAPSPIPGLDTLPSDEGPIFSIEQEARSFLQLLVDKGDLELEEDTEVADLAPGLAPILTSRRSSEAKATAVSSWLLDQDGVEELYMNDETLADLLEHW